MAKPGDVVEFKPGLHGIEAPRNIAILLDRRRRKGVPWVKLLTVDGEQEIKAEHLSRRAFKQRYDGDRRDTSEMQARLRFLISQHSDGHLVEVVDDDVAAIETELWEATCDAGKDAWSEDDLAEALYGEEASPAQRKQVRAALDRCRRPGTGRFETVAGRGDTWRPWSRGEHEAMRKAWSELGDLRGRLIEVEETDDGRSFRRVEVDSWTEAEEATLEWVARAMQQFIEHDGVPQKDVVGIGGYGAVAAFGMDLHRMLGFLAMDWIRSTPTTRSSDYVHFLLETGLWSADDAVASLMRRHVNQEPFFEHVPDPDAAAAADALPRPDEDAPEELASGRDDLRHLTCHTIDPPDAKDFDDAVGIEWLGDGTRRLWVHIADVSHYVRDGSGLDRHARDRATSVYLPGRVLPMLPARIADDLCSLRDDGDRMAVSVALDIDAEGHVKGASFHRSLIRVDENLSYDEALRRADAGQSPFVELLRLSEQMRAHRRGLAFETGEIRVSVEESGFEAQEKFATPATQMIEAFMVAANEAVARHLAEKGLPLLYRCHPLPDAQKAERFRNQLATVGVAIDLELPVPEGASSSGSQSLLDQLKAGGGSLELFGGGMSIQGGASEEPEEPAGDEEGQAGSGFATLDEDEQEQWLAPMRVASEAIAQMGDRGRAKVLTYKLLSCMGQAYYTPQNIGHYGLASTHYCHFTSPIRRYPDLVVHRNLKWLIDNPDGDPEGAPHPADMLEALCDHCSDQERAAAGLERRLKASCLVLASLHGGDAFADAEARLSGIAPNRIFLDVGGIDASVAGRDLPGGPYSVDEWESMLFVSDREAPQRFDASDLSSLEQTFDEELGEMIRIRARLGDRLTVHLAGRDVAAGRTDARVLKWPGEA